MITKRRAGLMFALMLMAGSAFGTQIQISGVVVASGVREGATPVGSIYSGPTAFSGFFDFDTYSGSGALRTVITNINLVFADGLEIHKNGAGFNSWDADSLTYLDTSSVGSVAPLGYEQTGWELQGFDLIFSNPAGTSLSDPFAAFDPLAPNFEMFQMRQIRFGGDFRPVDAAPGIRDFFEIRARIDQVSVPEPATGGLFTLGLLSFGLMSRRLRVR